MKKQIILILCAMSMSLTMAAQTTKKTDAIKVHGNCTMCKEKIESSLLKKDGIISKRWDVTTKILTVTYDPDKITVKQIGSKIAAVGYDNEFAVAPDNVYDSLHHCCKYKRPGAK